MKGLSTEEVGLLTEMKDRCLNKGLYIDENAEKKFKMLCHLEDFSIQYYELQNNWNELKNYLEKQIIDSKSASSQQYYFNTIYKFMQELEQGSDSNVKD